MNVPNENKLIHLLLNYKNDEDNTNDLPEHSLMNTACIKQVSKSITDIIYTSFRNKNESSLEHRRVSVVNKFILYCFYIM